MQLIDDILLKVNDNFNIIINLNNHELLYTEIYNLYNYLLNNPSNAKRVTRKIINGKQYFNKDKENISIEQYKNYAILFHIQKIGILIKLNYSSGEITVEFLKRNISSYNNNIFIKIHGNNEYINISDFISMLKTMYKFNLYTVYNNEPIGKYITFKNADNNFELYYVKVKNRYIPDSLHIMSYYSIQG